MKFFISIFTRVVPRKYLQVFSGFIARIIALFYLGNKVECPVCGKHYKKFLPYGRKVSRPNALCPYCLSLERHRMMWLFLQKRTGFFTKPYKVLHIAPEYCFLKRFDKLENIEYITADLESPWAKVKMDVKDMPFENHAFDVIFCNHLLEHIDDEQKALDELYRVMKPGGWGIMLVPLNYSREKTYEDLTITSPKEREKHFGQNDHVREYGLDYPKRLEKGKFIVSTIDFVKELPKEETQRYALPNEYIFFVEKPFKE